jgi:hypothetical protein
MSAETMLSSNKGRAIFAAAWAGVLAAGWRYVTANAKFEMLASRGESLNWALTLLVRTAAYLTVLTVVLWVGLALYLAAVGRFGLKNLARGLVVIVFVLFVALGIESFLRVEHLSAVAEFVLRWLPMFASLFAGFRFAVPTERDALFTKAAGKSSGS